MIGESLTPSPNKTEDELGRSLDCVAFECQVSIGSYMISGEQEERRKAEFQERLAARAWGKAQVPALPLQSYCRDEDEVGRHSG